MNMAPPDTEGRDAFHSFIRGVERYTIQEGEGVGLAEGVSHVR